MKHLTLIFVLAITSAPYILFSQTAISKLNNAAPRFSATTMPFKFKGAILRPIATTTTSAVSSDRKTTRDGVTREVLAYDGSTTGSAERETGTERNSKSDNTICNSQNVILTAGFSELNLLDPSAVEIWPGRLVKISSMDDGSYTSFTDFTSRKNMNIAMIAAGTSTTSVIRMVPGASVSQGSVVNAVNSMKNQFGRNDFGSDSWMYDSYNVFNSDQFLIEAGAGVNATPINLSVSANAGFNSSVKKNKIVLRFVREAFDVKVDSDLDDIVEAANLSNDAGIVASVSYGQFGMIEIESDSSLTDMNAALDFAFNVDPTVGVSGSLRTQLSSTLNSFSMRGIFKGVQGNSNIITIPSINDLKNMLLGNRNITATTPVVPLAFIIKSLKDGSTMMLKSTMSYTKKECTVLPPASETRLKIKLIALTVPKVNDGFSNDEDIFGKIRLKYNDNAYKTVWNRIKERNVKVQQSTRPTDPGAYSLIGDATTLDFTVSNDPAIIQSKKIRINVKLEDEEAFKVTYNEKTLDVMVTDLIQSLNATGTTSIDNFDSVEKAFFIDVVESGNTNKVRVWFRAQKTN